jgi:NAD(P)H-dependent FMN reductase
MTAPMKPETRLLFLAGSARRKSFNKRLARLAADISETNGIASTFVDLADYPMPIYDGDTEMTDGPRRSTKARAPS